MASKPKVQSNSLPTGEPSIEEIQGAHTSYIPARIYSRAELPEEGQPDTGNAILDQDGNAIPEESLFRFTGRPSNTLADFYWTYMTLQTLENFAKDATDGRALMLAHDISDMPLGYSYAGRVVVDSEEEQEARAALARIDSRQPLLSPTDPLAWFFADFYIVRGTNLAKRSSDEVIYGIQSRVIRDMSVQFSAERQQCSICGLDMWDWNCPHIPGVEYDPFGETVRCLVANINAELLENSLVYKGATPDAGVVETKARMVTSTERLTPGEARQLAALEARIGKRLLDPAQMQRAWTKVVPGISLPAPSARSTSQTKETTNMAKKVTNVRAPEDPTAGGEGEGGSSDVEQVIADQATSDAAALATQIEAKQGEITAQEQVIAGIEAQISGAEGATDDEGNPVDNTELIAGLNTQLEGEQAKLTALNDELTALQAELEGVNATADATGGTPADPPAASGSSDPPAVPPGGANSANSANSATPASTAQRARAALQQMQTMMRTHVAPLRVQVRDATDADLQPIKDAAQALVDSLNALLTDTGEEPARAASDRVILDALRRAAGPDVRKVSIVHVRALVQDAKAGKRYRETLEQECVAAEVRVKGPGHVNEEQYRRMLRNLSVEDMEELLQNQGEAAKGIFTAGRSVTPVKGSGTVDQEDPDELPTYNSGHGTLFEN